MACATSTYYTYPTAHGPLTIGATKHGICEIAFDDQPLSGEKRATQITNDAATQIQQYLAGKRQSFDVPIDLHGSAFQKAVWTEVCAIPYGQTATAADIAGALGKPGAHRSVGTAIKQCTLAPLVPTHRVPVANATGKRAKIMRAFAALEAHASR